MTGKGSSHHLWREIIGSAVGAIYAVDWLEALPAILQAHQTLARFAWQFPHNPKLSRYLHQVRLPTLIIWGKNGGVVSPVYGQGYRDGIAGAELVIIPTCGYLPHVE